MRKLIAERKFDGDARRMVGDIEAMLQIARLRWTDVVRVQTFGGADAAHLCLWEETLTDGSKVYNLQIL